MNFNEMQNCVTLAMHNCSPDHNNRKCK